MNATESLSNLQLCASQCHSSTIRHFLKYHGVNSHSEKLENQLVLFTVRQQRGRSAHLTPPYRQESAPRGLKSWDHSCDH